MTPFPPKSVAKITFLFQMETLYNLQLFFKEPIKDAELEASNKVFQLVFPSVKVLAGKFEMC